MRVFEEAESTAFGNQLELTLTGLTALKRGDVSVRLPREWQGLPGKVARAFNDVVAGNARMAARLERSVPSAGTRSQPRTPPPGETGSLNGETKAVLAALSSLKRGNPSVRRQVQPHAPGPEGSQHADRGPAQAVAVPGGRAQAVRKIHSCRDLPIIAVTAKAMKGDRERCIEAGVWDYLSTPVDSGHMLSVVRAWLHR